MNEARIAGACRTTPLKFWLAMLWLAASSCALAQPRPVVATSASPQASASSEADWKQLNAQQKQALLPLASRWGELTALQKSKWLALSKNFGQLSTLEQQTLHARMSEWVALSPQERNRARLNFNVVQRLPKEDVKAKWDEYQALTPEQRKQLAAGVYVPAKSAAPANKPTPADRLVQPPPRLAPSAGQARASSAIDRNTLLPLPPPAPLSPASEPAAGAAQDSQTSPAGTDSSPS